MNSVSTKNMNAAISVAPASDAKASESSNADNSFGQVLAHEVGRKESRPQAATAEAGPEKQPLAEQPEATDASAWLLMLQQPATQSAVAQAELKPGIDGETQPLDAQQDATANGQQNIGLALLSGSTVRALDKLTLKVDSAAAANTTLEGGKALPQAQLVAVNQPSTGADETPLAQAGLVDVLQATASDEVDADVPTLSNNFGQLLSAARSTAQSNVAPAQITQATITEPVGGNRWGDAVAQHVTLMLGKQEQQMEMQLNPPHLGPMEVRLTLGSEQASVVFTSQHAAVREALAAATPRLTALLADQGIHLVNVQVASDSLNQHAQEQAGQQAASQDARSGQRQAIGFQYDDKSSVHTLSGVNIPVARSGVSLYV